MLFVQPSTQCKGIGTALLWRVLAVARAQGVPRGQVPIGTDNPQAQQFFHSLGPTLTGRRVPGVRSAGIQRRAMS